MLVSRKKFRSVWSAALCTLLLGSVVAACGNDDPAGSTGAQPSGETIQATIGETPGIPTFFMQFGVSKGFFKDEGIDLKVTSIPGGAQQATAALSGDAQFTGGDVVSWNTFRSRDIPMKVIAPGSSGTDDTASDFSGVLVPANSPIKSPKDLAGVTIAVNELNNVGTVTIKGALEKNGVDPNSVSFTEIPFPDMLPNLANGNVDAAWIIEPFTTIGQAQGNRAVLYPYAEYRPNMQVGLVLATAQFAQENPEAVEAFQRAHKRLREYVTQNPDEFRQALVDLGDFKPEIVQRLVLPNYNEKLDRETIQQVADSMVKYGVLKSVPDPADFIDDNA